MKPFHRASRLEDVVWLAPKLRKEDERECNTMGHTGEQALCLGYTCSTLCRSVIDSKGSVVAMYGVSPISDISGRVWMLGSKGLLKISREFLKGSKGEVESMHKLYPHLMNYIDSRNEVHVRWIRWLGFKILGEVMVNSVKFYEFGRIG